MKKIKTIKLVLNIVITLAVLTLYSKSLFGMNYHELAGLLILLPIAAHIVINAKLMINMYKNYRKVPISIKICFAVDIILLIIFIWVGISGVFISRTILTGISSKNMLFKATHQLFGKVTSVLLGIHIGLHLSWRKLKPWLAIALTIIALASAVAGIANSQGGSGGHGPNHMQGKMQSPPEMNEGGERPEGMPQFDGDEKGEMPDFENGERPNNMPAGTGNQADASSKVFILLKYFGIMSSAAMATYWIHGISKKKKITD